MTNITKKTLIAAGVIAALGITATTSAFAADVPAGVQLADKQEIVKNNGSEVQSLDPHKIEGVPENNVTRDLMEGLANNSPDGSIVPGVAESWDNKDFKVWTFHLRKDAKWSNGKPVTAQDFVYSWQRVVDPKTASPYASYLQYAHVENVDDIIAGKKDKSTLGVKAIDDHTFQVTLSEPVPYLVEMTPHYAMKPVYKDAVEKFGEKWTLPANYVSNGAYKLKDWIVNERIVLERNPEYWDNAKTIINKVTFLPISSEVTDVNRYRTGEIDMTYNNMPIELFQAAVFQDDVLHRFQFFTLQQIAAVGSEALAYRIIDSVNDDDRLFGSADNAAVEGFGHQDRGDHAFDICGFVYHDRRIAGADADCRFAGTVGGFHHARATGGEDQVDVRVVHQLVGQLDGRLVDPTDDVFRRTGGDSGLQHDIGGFVGGILRTRVRREDDAIAGFQADQRFEDRGRSWVGGRHDTANQADRFGDGDGTESVIFRQDATGFFIFIGVVDVLGSEVVFDHFVFDDTHSGFFHGHFGQWDTGISSGEGGSAEDFIHLLLSEVGIFALGFFDTCDKLVQFSDIRYSHNALLIMLNSFSK